MSYLHHTNSSYYGNIWLSCRGFITCQTTGSDGPGVATIKVLVDSFSEATTQNFIYFSDPVYSDIIPKYSFTS